MAGRFPGMDPYIELQAAWPDFHNGLIAEIRNELGARLPDSVEIDLLLGGAPLPMKERIDSVTYYAIVARGARLPVAEVFRWTVRDPLPHLPIPLCEPDADILIELGVLVNRVYDLGRYARTLQYDAPFPESTSLTPEDRAWVELESGHVEPRSR